MMENYDYECPYCGEKYNDGEMLYFNEKDMAETDCYNKCGEEFYIHRSAIIIYGAFPKEKK